MERLDPPKKLFIFAEYETTQMWSENGTIFRVYKPLQHGSKDTSLCLGFVPQPTEDLKRPKILVDNLDQNCQINRQKRKEVISSTQTLLLYEGMYSNDAALIGWVKFFRSFLPGV